MRVAPVDPAINQINWGVLQTLKNSFDSTTSNRRVFFRIINCAPLGSHNYKITFQTDTGVILEAIVKGSEVSATCKQLTRLEIKKWLNLSLPNLGFQCDLPNNPSLNICGLHLSLPKVLIAPVHGDTGPIPAHLLTTLSFKPEAIDVVGALTGYHHDGVVQYKGEEIDGLPGNLRLECNIEFDAKRRMRGGIVDRLLVGLKADRGQRPLECIKYKGAWHIFGDNLTYEVGALIPNNGIRLKRSWPALGSVFLLGLGFGLWKWIQSDDKWALNRENLDLAYNIVSSFVPMGLGASLASGFAYDEVASRYT